MVSVETKKNSKLTLDNWLKENSYFESRGIKGNFYIANSITKGNIALQLIDREPHQPHVNCVTRENFHKHLSMASIHKCKTLFYVMYLVENGIQVFIPQTVIKDFFSDLSKKWYVLSMSIADFSEHRKRGIIIRKI